MTTYTQFRLLSEKLPYKLDNDPNTKIDISLVAGEPDDVGCSEELGEVIIIGLEDIDVAHTHYLTILKQLEAE